LAPKTAQENQRLDGPSLRGRVRMVQVWAVGCRALGHGVASEAAKRRAPLTSNPMKSPSTQTQNEFFRPSPIVLLCPIMAVQREGNRREKKKKEEAASIAASPPEGPRTAAHALDPRSPGGAPEAQDTRPNQRETSCAPPPAIGHDPTAPASTCSRTARSGSAARRSATPRRKGQPHVRRPARSARAHHGRTVPPIPAR